MSKYVTPIPVICPSCKSINSAAQNAIGQGAPQTGDAALCFTCGEMFIFTDLNPGGARQPTPDEEAELASDPMVRALRGHWQTAVRR